jgi:hypothetical protein
MKSKLLIFLLFITFTYSCSTDKTETSNNNNDPVAVSTSPAPKPKPTYVRPTTADNGQPFPTKSGYIKKYPKKATNGYSSLTIKNDQNDSDVFVKVFDLNAKKPRPVRVFFIRARESFTAKEITPGKYDVRYRDLNSGSHAKSEDFELVEIKKNQQIEYRNMTMTLYKVAHGNMKTEDIDPQDFE